jgi:hypothetical protein
LGETHNGSTGARTRLIGGARRRRLRADELLESALRRGKRSDFADRTFIRPLEQLLAACNEQADLSGLGARALRIDVLRWLRNPLYLEGIEAGCPSVLARPALMGPAHTKNRTARATSSDHH